MFHIVDDVPELRDILSEIIASKGYKTMQFDSAESYLEYFNSEAYMAPIAILSDYMMAGQTGLQLIKKVREKLPLQKAVIISGTPCSDFKANIEPYLCYSLTKPYRMEKLFSLLEALIKCDKHCLSNPDHTHHIQCIYGLEHECPFHSDKTAQLTRGFCT